MKFLFLSALFFYFNFLSAVAPDFSRFKVKRNITHKFYSLTTNDGLSDNFIYDIYQDKVGYMWFATANGLSKYDGNEFENYRKMAKDSTSISDNHITSIAEDFYGNLWIGTSNGLNKYNRKDNNFVRYFNDEHNANSLSDNFIRALYGDTTGILWIDTDEGVLNEYDIITNSFSHYSHKKNNEQYSYAQVYEDSKGKLWIGGRGVGPYKFNRKTKELKTVNWKINNGLNNIFSDASCFLEDSKGNFWLGDGAKKLVILEDVDTKKVKNCRFSSPYTILEDNRQNIWVGGWGNGAFCYDLDRKIISIHNHRENDEYSIVSNQINKIYQDKSGVLWFGTSNGISRYAPRKDIFEHFRHIPNEKKSLTSSRITAVTEDKSGIIWLGTARKGLDKFDPKRNSVTNFYHKNDNIDFLNISCLYEDKSTNDLYVGLWLGEGFDIFNTKTEKFTRYRYKKDRASDWYADFLEIDDEQLLIGLWGPGPVFFDKKKGGFTQKLSYSKFDYRSITGAISSTYFDKSNQKLWYSQNGIISFADDNRKMELGRRVLEEEDSAHNRMCSFSKIYEIVKGVDDNLWFCAEDRILKYNYQNDKFSYFQFKQKEKDSFLNLYCIYYDRERNVVLVGSEEGIIEFNTLSEQYKFINSFKIPIKKIKNEGKDTLWIGSDEGLYLYNLKDSNILKKYCYNPNIKNSLSSNKITEIYRDLSDNLWVGTDNGLNLLNDDKQTFTVFKNTKQNSISYNFITTIFQNSSHYLWIGTENGLNRLDLRNDIFTNFKNNIQDTTSISSNKIYSISGDDNHIWIGTEKGLCRYIANDKFQQYAKPADTALSTRLISKMVKDKNGNIWIGSTNAGLNFYNYKTKKFKYYRHLPFDSTSLNSDMINAIFEDSKGVIWIGGNGLNRFNPKQDNFTHYTTKEGLSSNEIVGILEDEHYNLWLSTDKGISKFNISTGKIINFDVDDGLQENEFNTKTECKLKNGKMVFAGNNGLNMFHPDSIRQNQYIPPIVLKEYKNGNKIIHDLSNIDSLNLKYDENSFEFKFAALDYNHPVENRYKYKLEGFDKDWTLTNSKDRKAKYTNIPPGKYTFIVKGSNNANRWNETGRLIYIIIYPPFWQTLPFILSYILIGIFILYLIHKIKVKSIVNYSKKLENIVAIRTKKIQNQNEELERKNFLISESIHCAANIQSSLLNNKKTILKEFKNNFILFEPKDVVSGDFYWSYKKENLNYIAVIDCTGHGVPGAFIALIGYTLLEKIMKKDKNITPAKILTQLNSEFIEMIHNNKPPRFPAETMEICLLQIDKHSKEIIFSGAIRPLYIFNDNNFEIIRGTNFSIGEELKADFAEYKFKCDIPTMLYLTTDGLIDQNNNQNKKFGKRRLEELIIKNARYKLNIQKENFLYELNNFRKEEPLRDDITVIGIKI